MKKGFTLIELLAVIVILAIIALIATPIVLNIINDVKESAQLRSASFYLDAVEYAIAKSTLNGTSIPSGTYNVMEDSNVCLGILSNGVCSGDKLKVEIKGESPEENSTITILDGKIKEVNLKYGEKEIGKNADGEIVYIKRTLKEEILKHAQDNKYYKEEDPTFAQQTTDNEYGLYSMQDNDGVSYYYRGDVTNNYVKFGKWEEEFAIYLLDLGEDYGYYEFHTLEDCETEAESWELVGKCEKQIRADKGDDMYWRIVRINGDGTIRMIYAGTETKENGANYNVTLDGIMVENEFYMKKYKMYQDYTTEAEDSAKKVVEKWYTDNLESKYGNYIADGDFCNDRELVEHKAPQSEVEYVPAPYDRVIYFDESCFFDDYGEPEGGGEWFCDYTYNPKPQLTCKEDYTLNVTNNKLSKPIGLISADELLLSGMIFEENKSSSYLNSRQEYYSMSPAMYSEMLGINTEWGIYNSMEDNDYDMQLRPVINLKANVNFKGKGTVDSPYEIIPG